MQKSSMNPTLRDGSSTAVKGKWIPFSAPAETGVNFLVELYHTGVGYSTINTTKCALSTCILIDGCKSLGSHPLVSRFIEGVFESTPTLPKYSETWDIKQVLVIYKLYIHQNLLH